jgi:DNA-binding MarR family transcriptional regulator
MAVELAARPASGGSARDPRVKRVELERAPGRRVNHRTVSVLRVVAGEPGLRNREVALRAGVRDQGQISRILARLERLGLIENARGARARGGASAWRLTARGQELEAAISLEAAAASVAFDLPEAFRGRLDYGAVSLLRLIGDRPWLYTRELALHAGVRYPAEISELLARLAGLGLVASARDAHRSGPPKAWRLTASGQQLDSAIGRDTAAPRRSVALDLMWASGGRLSEDGVSVLRVIAVEPGLANTKIALRVGISDQNSMSHLLARLARRGLIENTRIRGRKNVWQLTASGRQLETAIRHETPDPVGEGSTRPPAIAGA